MTTVSMPVEFLDDPIAPHSAQFPLARPRGLRAPESGVPSAPDVRPWGLRGMLVARAQGDPMCERFSYDHATQTALGPGGRALVAEDPSADSKSDQDGDEGRSEDWEYDFCPDQPFQV